MKISTESLIPKIVIMISLIGLGSGLSSGQVLVGYNFAGLTGTVTNTDNSTIPPTVTSGQSGGAEVFVAPNTNDGSDYNSGTVIASNLTRGSNYGTQVQNQGPNGTPPFSAYFSNNSLGIQPVNNTFGTAISSSIAAGDYAQFQVSGNGGSLSLSSVSFGGGSQDADLTLGFAYSTDGGNTFSTAGIDGGDNGIPIGDYISGNGSTGNPYLVTLNLNGISALQNVTGPVTLDFFTLDAGGYTTATLSSDSSGTPSNLDDITLNGTVSAVPEPSTWALILGGVGLLVFLQRRTRRA